MNSESRPSRYEHVAGQLSEELKVESLTEHFPFLAEEIGSRAVFAVRADLNAAGSYKWRGAFNAVSYAVSQGAEQFIAASAGNHGIGTMMAVHAFNKKLRLYTPASAPYEKSYAQIERWKALGGREGNFELYVEGDDFEATLERAKTAHRAIPEATFIHAYDNPFVVHGQKSLSYDILRAVPDVTRLIAPVGGGGLTAGLQIGIDQVDSSIRLHAVEASGSHSLSLSMHKDLLHPIEAGNPNKKYGGTAVRKVGHYPYAMLRDSSFDPDNILTAYDDGVLDLAENYHERTPDIIPMEPTSLLAVQGLRELLLERRRGRRMENDDVTVVVITGHNEPYTNLMKSKLTRFHAISGYTNLTPPSSR